MFPYRGGYKTKIKITGGAMATENTHFGAVRIGKMLEGCESIYFIGIGGINMSSLAHLSFRAGYRVGGSDRSESELTRRLEACGIEINYSHNAENVEGYGAVVYTVAISPDNPEYVRACELGIPCISRADYLGYIMTSYKRRIGVSGMHGKSTCTSMCALTFMLAGADPTVLSGAELREMGGAYRIGDGEDFIFEACEYMDSFLDFNPNVAVILNIEMDHVDYFKSMEHIVSSYGRYADIAGIDGAAVINGDDPRVILAVKDFGGRKVTFGINSPELDLRAENIEKVRGRYCFDIVAFGKELCHVCLSVTGYHNIYNALATAAVLSGLDGADIKRGLESFSGAARRMEYKGRLNGADVYDDYAHHPTEVKATLAGAKGMSEGRLWCVFQSHTYSRTKALLEEFSHAFEDADKVVIVDIYPARETDTLGMSPAVMAERIKGAMPCPRLEDAAALLCREVTEDDTVIIMGAGNINRIFSILERDMIKLDKGSKK